MKINSRAHRRLLKAPALTVAITYAVYRTSDDPNFGVLQSKVLDVQLILLCYACVVKQSVFVCWYYVGMCVICPSVGVLRVCKDVQHVRLFVCKVFVCSVTCASVCV